MKITDIRDKLPRAWQWSTRPLDAIKYVSVHHDAGHVDGKYAAIERYQSQARYHIGKGWASLAYHYKIDRDGNVYHCNNDEWLTYHAGKANYKALSVCLDGNFQLQHPTELQLYALQRFLDEKTSEYSLTSKSVYRHGETPGYTGGTVCCGKYLKDEVKKYHDLGYIFKTREEYDAEYMNQWYQWKKGKLQFVVSMRSLGTKPLSDLILAFRADKNVTEKTESVFSSGFGKVKHVHEDIYHGIVNVDDNQPRTIPNGLYREDWGLAYSVGGDYVTDFNCWYEMGVV